MSNRTEIVRIESEIGEALSKATGETAKILRKSKRDLAGIISKLPEEAGLSVKQHLKMLKVNQRLLEVPVTDVLKPTTTRWVIDLLTLSLRQPT